MIYPSITDINRDADYQVSLPNGTKGSVYAQSVPTSYSMEALEDETTFFRMPAQKRPFQKLKKEGKILMAPHRVINETVTNHIVKARRERGWDFIFSASGPGTTCAYRVGPFEPLLRYSEQGDLRYWSDLTKGGVQTTVLDEVPDVTAAIRSTQSSAVAAFVSGYDLLTELAESREALQFFGSTSMKAAQMFEKLFAEDPDTLRRAVKGRYTPQKLLRSADKALRSLGSKWMAYRYAIMPIFYSFKDVKELFENEGLLFKTYRAKDEITLTPSAIPSGVSARIFVTRSGSINVRSTVKAGYSKSGLQSFVANQVGFNPFATAYELIPLSFVFDWIVNMGDFIVSHTSLDFSEQSAMCTTIRTKFDTRYTLVLNQEYVYNYTRGPSNCFPTPETSTFSYTTENEDLLQLKTVDNYERFLFSRHDVSLSLNSSMMNWKRYIDASVLSYQPLKKLLTKILK